MRSRQGRAGARADVRSDAGCGGEEGPAWFLHAANAWMHRKGSSSGSRRVRCASPAGAALSCAPRKGTSDRASSRRKRDQILGVFRGRVGYCVVKKCEAGPGPRQRPSPGARLERETRRSESSRSRKRASPRLPRWPAVDEPLRGVAICLAAVDGSIRTTPESPGWFVSIYLCAASPRRVLPDHLGTASNDAGQRRALCRSRVRRREARADEAR